MSELTPQHQRLKELEVSIQSGFSLIEQGEREIRQALLEVFDQQLWRFAIDSEGYALYESFDSYCRLRWKRAERTIYQRIEAGRVELQMLQSGQQPPEPTSQLLELKDVDEPLRVEVIHTAQQITGGKPTAGSIRQAKEIVDPTPKRKPVTPIAGRQYRVVGEATPHTGKVITITQVDGNLATDMEHGYPYMPTELELVDTAPKPTPVAVVPKPTASDRIRQLKGLLLECLDHVPPELKQRIRQSLS
ncbi:MAG: hypothetical protein F6K00_19530 [Leptolyngbya sp. SIOISBB]|nr:hypothetical protein [Leptolyngbya sp. SIOISBB]